MSPYFKPCRIFKVFFPQTCVFSGILNFQEHLVSCMKGTGIESMSLLKRLKVGFFLDDSENDGESWNNMASSISSL